jgi:transposase
LQKSVITTILRDGVSIRAIAREINVAKNIVAKRKFEQTGTIRTKQGTGRMKVSQGNDDALLVNFLREKCTAIRATANKIVLTVANKRERLRFAHQYLNDDNFWANVIFSNKRNF